MASAAPFTGLDQEAQICAHCGYCQAVCPTYAALGWESAGPRGRMTLAAAALRDADGLDRLPDEAAQRIYECTLCGHCREACATRIDTMAAWLEARRRLADRGALDRLPLGRLRDNLRASHNVTGDSAENRLLWQADLEAPAPGINGRAGAGAIYFVGCVTGLYGQGHPIAQAAAEVFTRAGVDFTTLGGEEWCCGFPYLGLGLPDEAAAVARHNLAAVAALGAKLVVTTCPSCYHMWRFTYPELLGAPLPVEIRHASELVARLLTEGRLELAPLDERVTYHDPCDLGRNSGIYDAPRAVLRAIPGLELVEMADNRENALCCGGGGNLEAVNSDLVAQIAQRRIAQAVETGASILVTPCQQCKRTLANAARKARLRLKVLDLNEIVIRSCAPQVWQAVVDATTA
jgi:Fe-S oxidoreductase